MTALDTMAAGTVERHQALSEPRRDIVLRAPLAGRSRPSVTHAHFRAVQPNPRDGSCSSDVVRLTPRSVPLGQAP